MTLNNMKNLGYLVWEKIPQECLQMTDLESMLEESRFNLDDKLHRLVLATKGRILSSIGELLARSVTTIRTGLSWAEWDTPGGRAFIEWHLRECYRAGLDILPDLTFTPPRLGIRPIINSPPRDPLDYARAVHDICSSPIGPYLKRIEFLNEFNLDTDWLGELDPELGILSHMGALAKLVMRHHGKELVLGGVAGVREQSLAVFRKLMRYGFMRYVDVIGFHSLRGTWSDQTPPPSLDEQAEALRSVAGEEPDPNLEQELEAKVRASADQAEGELRDIILSELERLPPRQSRERIPVWLTEYGFPAVDPEEKYDERFLENIQAALFADALRHLSEGKLERIYWYTLRDRVSPSVRAHTTGFEDPLQYYYGDSKEDGKQKLLGRLLYEGGPERVFAYVQEKDLWHLVGEASLKRHRPFGYSSQDRA